MEPARLARLVRGELDWIVMKTLEKDRSRRYDASSERGLFTIQSGDSRIVRLVYRPDGGALVSRTEGGQVKIHGPFGGQSARSLKEDPGIVDFLFSSDGGRMAVVSGNRESGQQVRLWDSGHPFNNRLLEFPKESVSGVVFTENTAHVIAIGPDGLIRVWDETGQAGLTLKDDVLGGVWGVAISPDGRVLAAGGALNTVQMWDAVTGEKKFAQELAERDSKGPVHVCFSPDAHRFVATTLILHVLDARTAAGATELSS